MGIEVGATDHDGTGITVAIVVATFNAEVTGGLLTGALKYLHDVGADVRRVVEVPGAFEIPLMAQALARTGSFDAIIALGAVVEGDTDHYEHVAHRASEGLMRVSLDEGIPVTFGILITRSAEAAIVRSAAGEDNKGAEAAAAALGAVRALRSI